jgi:hypothetical protein
MQARLGFAIAAHLEPEVLLVDEVLSVGDLAFQARALEKITQLVSQEIPVVMVTHELSMVTALCTHALLLDRGSVLCAGTPRECISAYLHGDAGVRPAAGGDGDLRIDCLELGDHTVNSGEAITLSLECSVRENGDASAETIRLRVRLAQTGETVFETGTGQLAVPLPAAGPFTLGFELQMNLPPGLYLIETLAWDREVGRESFIGPATHVKVGGSPFEGTAQLNPRVRLERPANRPVP